VKIAAYNDHDVGSFPEPWLLTTPTYSVGANVVMKSSDEGIRARMPVESKDPYGRRMSQNPSHIGVLRLRFVPQAGRTSAQNDTCGVNGSFYLITNLAMVCNCMFEVPS